eukprot:SM000419S15578  [mRNA]  locus=s419:13391:22051:+ [translate_table: standard]
MASAVAPSGERPAPQPPPACLPGGLPPLPALTATPSGSDAGVTSGLASPSPPPPRLVAGDLDLETGAPAPRLPPPALSRAALGSGLFAPAPPEPGPPPRRRPSWRSRSSICLKLALFVSILVLVTSGTLALTVWKYAHDDLESDIRLRLDTVATFKQQQASQDARAAQDATFSSMLAVVPRYLGAEAWASDVLMRSEAAGRLYSCSLLHCCGWARRHGRTAQVRQYLTEEEDKVRLNAARNYIRNLTSRYSDLEGPITDAATLGSLEQAQKYLVSSLSIVQEFLSLAVYNREGLLLLKVRQNATGVHDPPGKVPPLPMPLPEHRTPAQSTLSTSICIEPPYLHKDELRLNMTIAILDLVTINYVVTPEKHPAITKQPFSGPLALAIGGKSGFTRNQDNWNVAVATSYIPVGFLGWGLVAQINESEAYRLVHALTVVIIVAMCAILFVGLVATHFLAKASCLDGLKVLIIDGNKTSTEMTQNILERWAVRCASVSTVDEGSERLEEAVAGGERFHLVIVDLWIGSDYPRGYPRGQGEADYKKSEVATLLANLRQKPQLLEVWAKEGVEAGQPQGGEPEAGVQLTEQVVEASQYASSLETPRLGRTSSRHGGQCSNCSPGQCGHYVLDSPIEERGSGSAHVTPSTSPHGVRYETNDFCTRSPECDSQAGLGEAAHGAGTARATTASGASLPGAEHRLESCRLPVVLLTSCGHKDIARRRVNGTMERLTSQNALNSFQTLHSVVQVQMPVCDGLEATRRIRLLEADLGKPPTPVVAGWRVAPKSTRDGHPRAFEKVAV